MINVDKIFGNKYGIFFIISIFLICLFYKVYNPNETQYEKEIREYLESAEIPDSILNPDYQRCADTQMKWRGHLKYASGPFYELNLIREHSNLEELLSRKDSIKILKLNSRNLKALPEKIFHFKNLEALDISDNPFADLEKLMEDLAKFPKLELLAMSHCGIVKLPDNIKMLDGLVGLSLDQNINMIEVNESIGNLYKLKYLNFRRNKKLKDLPKSIGNLKCLEQIIISGAGFERIREELSLCTNLIDITANASKIKSLPNKIGNLKKLENLNLGSNKIEIVPESIGELNNLVYLTLGTNEISKLPESISKLKNLYSISLELNRFQIFPLEILDLKDLRYLDVHNNYIKEIPIDVANLPKLKRIYVDHEIITDQNIEFLREKNLSLEVERRDALRLVPDEPKRKE